MKSIHYIHPIVLRPPWIFLQHYILKLFICFRFRQRSIERVMDLTDSFTWEDLPTRDADTGHLTAAGWIPLIQMYATRVALVNLVFHCVQSTIRIVRGHETILIAWYPFDCSVSPFYELVNISQVTFSLCYKNKINLQSVLILFVTQQIRHFLYCFPRYCW
jgi:hypothetical protein